MALVKVSYQIQGLAEIEVPDQLLESYHAEEDDLWDIGDLPIQIGVQQLLQSSTTTDLEAAWQIKREPDASR